VINLYTPIKGTWERLNPNELDSLSIKNIEDFGGKTDCNFPKNLDDINVSDDPIQWAEKIGPMKDRGNPSGLVIKNGYIIAEWGDPGRVDMIFSVTKTFLPLITGIAYDKGLIKNVDDKLCNVEKSISLKMSNGKSIDGYDTQQNKDISWKHLLQQTSDWEGTLFTKPDLVDWNRNVPDMNPITRENRMKPGTHWEYNDVRVNRMALSLLCVFKQPLPEILKNNLLDPIGSSDTWEWHGYGEHSTVLLNNVPFESVPGGGHWGGGLWINTYDLARFGMLLLNNGFWNGKIVVSSKWIQKMLTPSDINPTYGFMIRLNTKNRLYGTIASEKSFIASGAGGNAVFVDPKKELIIVTRWCGNVNGLIELVLKSLNTVA
jgi:CubicO group peptidase (beta-lactamase class C family)|tara:strand:- start:331 stop:1455 length:1125 start_codon:yes stop_codon:yes gene_type:complete